MAFDDIKDKGLLSSRGMELLKARQERLQTKSVGEVRVINKITQDLSEIDKIIQAADGAIDDRLKQVKFLSERAEESKKLLQQLEQQRRHGAEKQFSSTMRTAMSGSAVSQDINSVTRSPTSFSSALELARSMSASDIQSEQERNRRLAVRQSSRIAETSQDVSGNEDKLIAQLKVRERAINQAGLYQAAMGAQKKLGLDPESRYYSAHETAQKTERDLTHMGIRADVRSGAIGDKQEVEKQLQSAMQKLIQTFEKLSSVTDKSSKEAAELADQFDQTASEIDKHKTALSEMNRMGGGGGAGMFSLIGNLGTLGMAGAQAYRHVGVTSELAQMQNRVGFANVQNSRFSDALGGTRGDMAALRRVLSGQAAGEAGFGLEMGNREGLASATEFGGQVGRAVGASEDALLSVKGVGNSVMRAIKGAPAAGIGAAVNVGAGAMAEASPEYLRAIQMGTDYGKQIPQGQTALQAAQTYRQLQDAINQIDDISTQGARDYSFNVGMSSRGLGGGREGLMGQLMDPSYRMGLAEVGMTDSDIARATSSGTGALGRQFRASDIGRGGELSRLGMMQSPDQYMGLLGQLSGSGGGSGNLETILKNAVANGMDSSKNIVEMVQGITSISQRSAEAGINTIAGSTQVMGRSLDQLIGGGMNPNMAAGVAQRSSQVAGDLTSNKGMDIYNAVEFAELQKMFPDAKPWELNRMANMSPDQIQELVGAFEGGDQDQIKKARLSMGASKITNADQARGVQGIMQRQGMGSLTGMPGSDMGLQASILNKDPSQYTEEEQMFAAAQGISRYGVSGMGTAAALAPGKARGGAIPGAIGGFAGSAEADRAAGAISDAKLFASGVEKFERAIGSFANLGATMEAVAKILDPTKMAGATKAAADSMSFSEGQFSDKMMPFTNAIVEASSAVNEFMEAVSRATKQLGAGNIPAANPSGNVNPRQGRRNVE